MRKGGDRAKSVYLLDFMKSNENSVKQTYNIHTCVQKNVFGGQFRIRNKKEPISNKVEKN